ncbi:hypothetical protein ACVWW1_009709 [Bradyrhizobium sp. JR3.5]
MRFDSVSIMPSACSATELALPPDWLTTSTPAAVQASTSTGSKPAPFEDTINRFGARFNSSAWAWKCGASSSRAAPI